MPLRFWQLGGRRADGRLFLKGFRLEVACPRKMVVRLRCWEKTQSARMAGRRMSWLADAWRVVWLR